MSANTLTRAAELLDESAAALRGYHTLSGDWGDEHEARESHDEMLAVAADLRAMIAASPTPPEQAAQPADVAPIDMVLHCPACGMQHIDRDEALNFKPEGTCTCAGPDGPCEACEANREAYEELWRNPPHRSHLCGACGHIWRPADVPTNGVPAVKTRGKADSPIRSPADVARLVKALELMLRGTNRDCNQVRMPSNEAVRAAFAAVDAARKEAE